MDLDVALNMDPKFEVYDFGLKKKTTVITNT